MNTPAVYHDRPHCGMSAHHQVLLFLQGVTPLHMVADMANNPPPPALVQLMLEDCASGDINSQDTQVPHYKQIHRLVTMHVKGSAAVELQCT